MSQTASPTIKVEAFLSGAWVNISADLVAAAGLHIKYGVEATDPTIVYPSVGTCSFTLRNDAGCSGGVQGYYSPRSASRRTGWGAAGVLCRVTFTYAGTDYVKHYGKIQTVDPAPGKYTSKRVVVSSNDIVNDLLVADASSVAIAVNNTEAQLISAVLAAIPTAVQPLATDIDTGLDTFTIAFDKVVAGTKALPTIRDAVISSLGVCFVKGNGTFCYRSRHSLALASSSLSMNDTMHGLNAISDVTKLYNHIRGTVHPKQVTATATDLLYTLPTGNATLFLANSTPQLVWCDYSDPNNRQTPIGGQSVVTALVANTHYKANAAADGSGTDLTANITATLTAYAARAVFSLTNSGPAAYITLLSIFGKAVRDPGPQVVEKTSVQPYGDTLLDIDLVFQNSANVAQDFVTFLHATYSTIRDVFTSVMFKANDNATNMAAAMSLEPFSAVTLTETVSGISNLKSLITSIELSVDGNGFLTCQWGLLPSAIGIVWQWGITGASEWGSGTVYGF